MSNQVSQIQYGLVREGVSSAARDALIGSLHASGADPTEPTGGYGPAVTFGSVQVSGVQYSYAASIDRIALMLSSYGGAAGADTVVVVGSRRSHSENFSWIDMGYEEGIADPEEWAAIVADLDSLVDKLSIEVTVNFVPTAMQQRMIDRYKSDINTVSERIQSIPDNAVLNIPGRGMVTGAEIKEVWFRSDFVINPEGTLYQNGTRRGEANPNGGDPIVSLNIDTLFGYGNSQAGRVFLILHEVAHTVTQSVLHNSEIHSDGNLSPEEHHEHERLANDIARAVASQIGLPTLSGASPELDGPEHGYTDGFPSFVVQEPTLPGEPDSAPPAPQETDAGPASRVDAWNGRTWIP